MRKGWLIAVVLAVAVLSACSVNWRQAVAPLPTLVPTLDLPEFPTATPFPSATPTLEPSFTLPASSEPSAPATRAVTATRTLTPWGEDTATVGPSPTITLTPTITRTPTRTRKPTFTPTITYTPTPPRPALYFLRPGLFSKVVSPIQTELYAVTGADGKITLELVGEDGRVISRQVISRGEDEGMRVWMAPEMPFEIEAAAEMARLQISSTDSFGRVIGLASVDLILLSVGRNEMNPPAIDQEPYLIRRPRAGDTVSGGVLEIEALARPVNESPLIIELVNESGTVLVTKKLAVEKPSGPLSHTPFTVEIPYRVSTSIPVRMVIRQEGSRIPGTVALLSRLIVLEP